MREIQSIKNQIKKQNASIMIFIVNKNNNTILRTSTKNGAAAL